MARVRLRRSAQITLPAELRRTFNLVEGDELEAEAVEGGILLRPVAARARRSLDEILGSVKYIGPEPRPSPEEEEEWIAREVMAFRREQAKRRR